MEKVQRAVAEYFDIRLAELRGTTRTRAVTYPRQIAMYFCKELIPGISLNQIGEAFGGKDASTVIYAYRKIHESRSDETMRAQIEALKKTVQS